MSFEEKSNGYFNSRPREEVDGGLVMDSNTSTIFQLTTSRGGRQPVQRRQNSRRSISTHDLARRSTGGRVAERHGGIFQLTTSRGGRPREEPEQKQERNISTHDLARRSTKDMLAKIRSQVYFNSRPREEVDSNFYAKSFPFKITFCAHCI